MTIKKKLTAANAELYGCCLNRTLKPSVQRLYWFLFGATKSNPSSELSKSNEKASEMVSSSDFLSLVNKGLSLPITSALTSEILTVES